MRHIRLPNQSTITGQENQIGSALIINKFFEKTTTNNAKKTLKKEVRKQKTDGKIFKKENTKRNRIYNCTKCNFNNTNKREMFKHLQTHVETQMSCIKCKNTFNSSECFEWHVNYLCKSNMAIKKFKCETCSMAFLTRRNLNRHLEGHKINNCPHCEKSISNKKLLIHHLLEEHSLQFKKANNKCEFCEKSYVKKQSLYSHLGKHFLDKFICLECGNICDTKEDLEVHKKDHEVKKHFACNECNAKFSRRHQYQDHIKKHSIYKCITCNRSLASRMSFKQHKMKKHKVIETTKVIQNLNDTGEILKCDDCDKVFKTQSVFHNHKKRFHNNSKEKIKCKYCDYETNNKANMVRHVSLHFSNEDEFICDKCGKSFNNNSSLLSHISFNHVKEKQFQCSTCHKQFKRKSELMRHEKSHSNERPHICKLCNNSYKQITHLRRHERNSHKLVNKSKKLDRLKLADDGLTSNEKNEDGTNVENVVVNEENSDLYSFIYLDLGKNMQYYEENASLNDDIQYLTALPHSST